MAVCLVEHLAVKTAVCLVDCLVKLVDCLVARKVASMAGGSVVYWGIMKVGVTAACWVEKTVQTFCQIQHMMHQHASYLMVQRRLRQRQCRSDHLHLHLLRRLQKLHCYHLQQPPIS